MGRHWSAALVVLVGCGGGDTFFIVDADGGPPPDAPAVCASDAVCDDGAFCNGLERCLPGSPGADLAGCVPGASPCLAGERCDEGGDACLASCAITPDADGDGVDAIACGGIDCDDTRADVFPGNDEVCDDANLDEDCDPATFGREDRDGDGFVSARCCNAGPDGLRCGADCSDERRDVRPGFIEVCDEVDNDCDGSTDEGVTVEAFVDADGDLRGAEGSVAVQVCAGRRGYSSVADDCDDTEISVHGAQLEITDGLDNDCDGTVDEGVTALRWYPDLDGDAYGDPEGEPVLSSAPLLALSLRPSDCDDGDRAVNPGAIELCDARDTDCDGRADFFIVPGLDTEDDDEDGFADATCGGADCDDANPAVGPGQVELADGLDNDCDGTVDESPGARDWYPDLDRDGWGDATATPTSSMTPRPASAPRAGDCDDGDATVRPGVRDACDGRDQDCDGTVDEDAPRELWYVDGDGDGFGDTDDAVFSCTPLAGRVLLPGDCADGSADVAPGATERCNDADDDCDGNVDEDVPDLWYPDGDGDGVGVMEGAVMTCDPGPGFATAVGDCADDDPARFPGAAERCNAIDDDCDGTTDGAAADALCAGAEGVARGSCGAMGCTIAACASGFADCDGLPETGCEVPTDRDPLNCGACRAACGAGDTCGTGTAGTCDESPLVDVTGGSFTFVAQRGNGRLLGWGESSSFEAGTGTASDLSRPESTVQGVVGSVTMAQHHGCGVRLDGRLQCWGANASSQLGTGDVTSRGTVTVPGVTDAAQVCGSLEHTCYRSRGGDVYCWGQGVEGMLGTGATTQLRRVPATPVAGLSGVVDIFCGVRFTCAMQPAAAGGREVYCWGSVAGDRLGERLSANRLAPSTPVPGLPSDVVAFARHGGAAMTTCVRTAAGEAWCWGSNAGSLRGTGGTASIGPSRVVVTGGTSLTGVVELSLGRFHACALVTTATPGRFTPYCWGNGGVGQLGIGLFGNSAIAPPLLVSAGGARLTAATTIALSQSATCLLRATGTGGRSELWCTGSRASGQLGDGLDTGNVRSPQRVSGL